MYICVNRHREDDAKQAQAAVARAWRLLPHTGAPAAEAAGQQQRRRSAEAPREPAHEAGGSSDDDWEVVEAYPAVGRASAAEEAAVRNLVAGDD